MVQTKYFVFFIIVILMLFGCADQDKTMTKNTIQDNPSNNGAVGSGKSTVKDEAWSSTLKNIVQNAKKQYFVSYELTTKDKDKISTGKISQYFKDDNLRVDGMQDGDDQAFESRYYVIENKFYLCSNQDSNWQCFSFDTPQQDTKEADISEEIKSENFDIDFVVKPMPSRAILGRSTVCFKIVPTKGKDFSETEQCYTKDGVLFYLASGGEDYSYTEIAIDYKPIVSDLDFQLPAEPEKFDFNGILNQG